VLKDPTLLDIFDFLKRGISVSIQEAQFKKEQIVIEEFTKIQESITSIYEFMLGEPKQ
jgi:1-phosphatidylinositol-4-phosphate 5-kinase